ncbi:MAG: exodeoxyribonuclease VII large subunit [Ktedonobacterales bacterium]|nr:exodeoxyribonuclease VII large subunit [Ktedonobacterales bacterium]
MRIVAVSELISYLKALMEEDYALQDVWVRGELTNYTQSSAGHRYFSLKDERSALRCVLFNGRGRAAVPPLRNGMAVLAHGRMSLYEARGDCQFYVDAIEDAGLGELHLRFEALKARLEAEGLFDVERKRPLPRCPEVVGLVTSTSAAALRDIVRTLRLRCPLVRIILAPALVQGEGAAEQVAAALDALNAHGECDVILVARGGGSLEELWAFNEEVVARAVARSRIPVVTGVGHETDFTIADFVADVRASTPTAAATVVVPDTTEWHADLALAGERLSAAMGDYLLGQRDTLAASGQRLDRASPHQQVARARQRTTQLVEALDLRLRHQLALRHEQLQGRALRLHALSPLATLGRGYALVRRQANGAIVSSVSQVAPGDALAIQVADGTFAAIADTSADAATAHTPTGTPVRASAAEHRETRESE